MTEQRDECAIQTKVILVKCDHQNAPEFQDGKKRCPDCDTVIYENYAAYCSD